MATLPNMGHHFEISLQMWIESYSNSEFLRFTTTENDCCNPGDRIPYIRLYKNGYVHVACHVGENPNFWRNFNLPVKTWINIVVKQYPENGKVVQYIIIIRCRECSIHKYMPLLLSLAF